MKERTTPRFTEDQLAGARTAARTVYDNILIALYEDECGVDREFRCQLVDRYMRDLAGDLGYRLVPLAEDRAEIAA